MAKRTTFNYNLKQKGKVVYKGTTNDLDKRAEEHRRDGKNSHPFKKWVEQKLN